MSQCKKLEKTLENGCSLCWYNRGSTRTLQNRTVQVDERSFYRKLSKEQNIQQDTEIPQTEEMTN